MSKHGKPADTQWKGWAQMGCWGALCLGETQMIHPVTEKTPQ